MNDKNKIDLSIEMYEDLKETLVKAIKNAKAGGVGNAGWENTQLERIERLIEAAELSQGQIAQLLERLQRHTALPGVKTEQEREFADRYNTKEPWYEMAKVNGNDVNIYFDYRITYYRPDSEPTSRDEWDTYIKWEDNQGNSGYKMKNQYHSQPYYPLWAGNTLSFTGTCLPQNAIDESGSGTYFVLYKFRYGYADNEINSYDDSSIDISWAVDASGNSVNLPGVDYIKIYTGVNQENGWLGECSTEIMGVEDLHLLKEEIHTRR